jgi:acyl-CoA thioester hydrolase
MGRHRVLTPLRWSDMDAYGHVNNVQFLRLIEDARVIAFAAAGSDEGGSVVDTGLLVARSEIEYLEPLVYRTAPVAIDLWVTRLAGASFDMGYEVLDEDVAAADDGDGHDPGHGHSHAHGHAHGYGQDGQGSGADAVRRLDEYGRPVRARPQVYARAETTLVLYDMVNHRPRRMTDGERERLEAWRGEPVAWRQRKARPVSR